MKLNELSEKVKLIIETKGIFCLVELILNAMTIQNL